VANPWIDPTKCKSLAILVESVVAPMLMKHPAPICLDLEIDPSIQLTTNPTVTADLIQALTRQALDEMSGGGDLTVTACETPNGIELEMADTGVDASERSHRIPMMAAAIDAHVTWQNCPQGGVAVMVTLPRRGQLQRRVA
jgi:hypothetical protein